MTGKVELRLRAIYDESVLMREVVQEDQGITRLRESLRGKPEDATYYERIQLGEMVAAAVERKREQDVDRMLERLVPLALAIEVGDPGNERVALNASFLVQRDGMTAFDAAVDELGREQEGRMRLKYTGPLPTHS